MSCNDKMRQEFYRMPMKISEIKEANKYDNLVDYKIMKYLKKHPHDAFFAEDLAKELDVIKATIWIRINHLEQKGLVIKTKITKRIAVHLPPSGVIEVLKKERKRE